MIEGPRDNEVKLRLSDREFLALAREAEREDRKVAEMGHAILRWYLFGRVTLNDSSTEVPDSPSRAR